MGVTAAPATNVACAAPVIRSKSCEYGTVTTLSRHIVAPKWRSAGIHPARRARYPHGMPEQHRQLTLRLPVELIERAESVAGRDRAVVLREAVRTGLDREHHADELRALRAEVSALRDELAEVKSTTESTHQATQKVQGLTRTLATWLARWPALRKRPPLPDPLKPQRKSKPKAKADTPPQPDQ